MDIEKIGKIAGLIVTYGTALSFAATGAADWYTYKNAATVDEYKRCSNGKTRCIWGTVAMVSWTIFLLILTIIVPKDHSQLPDDSLTTSTNIESESTSETTTLAIIPGVDGTHVSNQRYDSATYTGYIDDERKPHGEGKMAYDGGNVYQGNWEHGVIVGYGEMTYANGDTYKGYWEDNRRHGDNEDNIYTWKDGRKYVGAYKNDKRYGRGIFTNWADEETGYIGTYNGESINDRFEGQGSFVFDDDKLYLEQFTSFVGEFKNNKGWNGYYTRKDGSHYEIENGEPRG